MSQNDSKRFKSSQKLIKIIQNESLRVKISPIWVKMSLKWVQNKSKMSPKWVQKESKWVQISQCFILQDVLVKTISRM